MEERVRKLELSVTEIGQEAKMVTRSINSIDNTLKELKTFVAVIPDIKTDIAIFKQQEKVLEQRVNKLETIVETLSNNNSANNVKISNADKLIWSIVGIFFSLALYAIKGQ